MAQNNAAGAAAAREFYNKNISKLATFRANSKLDAENPREWIIKAIQAKEAAHWNDEDALANIALCLADEAKNWFLNLKLSSAYEPTWDFFVAQFKFAFVPSLSFVSVAKQAENLNQKNGEPIIKFFTRIQTALEDFRTLLPTYTIDMEDMEQPLRDEDELSEMALRWCQNHLRRYAQFMNRARAFATLANGLLPDYQAYLMTQPHNNDAELAVRFLVAYEQMRQNGTAKFTIAAIQPDHEETQPEPEQTSTQISPDMESAIEAILQKRGFPNKFQNQQNSSARSSNNQNNQSNQDNKSQIKCLFCQKPGHNQYKCYRRKQLKMPCIGKDNEPFFPKGEKNPFQKKDKDFQ